jgi:hypothetical protein
LFIQPLTGYYTKRYHLRDGNFKNLQNARWVFFAGRFGSHRISMPMELIESDKLRLPEAEAARGRKRKAKSRRTVKKKSRRR